MGAVVKASKLTGANSKDVCAEAEKTTGCGLGPAVAETFPIFRVK